MHELLKYFSLRLTACMRIIRLIMPTQRNSEARQRRTTDHMGADETVVGDVEKLIAWCRKGRTVAIDDIKTFARRTDQRVEIVRRIFERGALIATADGLLVGPEHAEILIAGMSSSKRVLAPEDAAKRGGHNRVPDEERDEAKKYWLDHELSVAQLEEYTGRPYSTLRNWFNAEHPRPDKRGRPRKR